MMVRARIEAKLREAFEPVHLEIVDDSHKHAVPPGSESHFNVLIVADRFTDCSLVRRHQAVNRALADELAGPVHALALSTLSPEEWRARGGGIAESPDCLGGGKRQRAG